MMRCKRCERMYDEERPGECHYHPGRYVGAGHHALLPHWTCCGHEHQYGGCRMMPEHLPCETTRRAMQAFQCPPESTGVAQSVATLSFDEDDPGAEDLVLEMPDGQTTVMAVAEPTLGAGRIAEQVASETGESAPTPASVPVGRVPSTSEMTEERYVVLPTDTFSGVALKHGMTVDALAELNGMTRSRLSMPGQVLRVVRPVMSPEDEEAHRRKLLVNRFKRVHRCTEQEARYYLDTNDFDWDAAVKERKEEMEWEHSLSSERQLQREQETAAEREAALLTAALSKAATSAATAWPTWLRPWEDKIMGAAWASQLHGPKRAKRLASIDSGIPLN
eukprot:CAMPEP_0185193438 /NCGR_PEP_ID=MMETSP1140-20130426/25919_1 /TAXON_ID=298111 /ORGANISM="Pavlova sp., Strain CCMP459" /LENGTH=333 /DNA_ID=CAMNT_0027760263 /DNA_START=15 /DNA_END=1017 /DNA_ORIENTATION=-